MHDNKLLITAQPIRNYPEMNKRGFLQQASLALLYTLYLNFFTKRNPKQLCYATLQCVAHLCLRNTILLLLLKFFATSKTNKKRKYLRLEYVHDESFYVTLKTFMKSNKTILRNMMTLQLFLGLLLSSVSVKKQKQLHQLISLSIICRCCANFPPFS